MTQDHPTPEVLESFVNGRLSPLKMKWVSRHLLSGCPPCRASASRLWGLKKGDAGHPDGPPGETGEKRDGYDEVFDRVFQKVSLREDDLSRERDAAQLLLEELLQHPIPRQHLLVANSTRFRNPSLCELLIEESHKAGFQDPSRTFELARLATAVAEVLTWPVCGGIGVLSTLRCRAWGQLGNALRIQGNLAASEAAFETAEKWIEEGEVDSLGTARVLDLKASLRKDQRRFAEAGELLDRVLSIYQGLGQWSLLGRTLKQKSMVCGEAGDLEQEMALLRQALELLDPEEEPRTFLAARHNLIVSLNETGRAREAYALLFQTRPLYLKMGDKTSLLLLRWLEGDVARGLGRIEQAEVAFREVRQAYLDLGLVYDAALASLDLAEVYILQGKTRDLRGLAEEMLEAFQARDIHREALGALAVFCAAARMENAGIGLVQEVSSFLKRARKNPDLQFTPTS